VTLETGDRVSELSTKVRRCRGTDYSFEMRQSANALALERLTERYQIVFGDSWKSAPVELAK
jgi:hypothetical protein